MPTGATAAGPDCAGGNTSAQISPGCGNSGRSSASCSIKWRMTVLSGAAMVAAGADPTEPAVACGIADPAQADVARHSNNKTQRPTGTPSDIAL